MENQMIDVRLPKFVEILIGKEDQIWINIDGICRLRIQNPLKLIITDERKES